MQLKIKNCPVCLKTEFEDILKTKDYLITQETFQIVKCKTCSFIFTNPRPFEYELEKYYQSTDYDSHKTKTKGIKDILYNLIRRYSTSKKLKYINKISKGRKLLDIGSGAGHFIDYCFKNNWEAEGLEPNLNSFPNINRSIKIHSSFKTIEKNSYDVITMWHSLEHISELDHTLRTIEEALKPQGKLIIAVPNINSFDSKHYKEFWAALDVPRHLYHFTQSSMKLLIERYGLRINEIKPLIFDSYYVSLLSETYQNGKMNYYKAFKMGWKSNQWAKKNNNNYSSLMYTIIKK